MHCLQVQEKVEPKTDALIFLSRTLIHAIALIDVRDSLRFISALYFSHPQPPLQPRFWSLKWDEEEKGWDLSQTPRWSASEAQSGKRKSC